MLRISFSDGIYRSHAPAFQSHVAQEVQAAHAAEARFSSSDSVQISSASSFKAVLSQEAKRCAAEIEAFAPAQRLEALGQKLASGSYNVDAGAVADRMLGRISAFAAGAGDE